MRISDWSSVLCSSDLELPHPEADDKLDDEIDGQRDRDPHDVARNGDDLASLEAEHCDDREEQRNERDRRDLRKEARLVPVIPLRAGQYLAGQEAGEERQDRKSGVKGKSVAVRLDLGGRRIIKKKTRTKHIQ